MNAKSVFVSFIKEVAGEQGYSLTDSDQKFEIYFEKHNAVAFELLVSSSNGYIQVHQWEGGSDGKYGRGVYSLRDYSDVAQFCNILIASASLRARRLSAA